VTAESLSDIKTVILAHTLQSPYVLFEVDGVRIRGLSTSIVPIGMPEVVLFTEDSTPRQCIRHDDAERLFQEAVRRLIRNGTVFLTVTRPGWNLPAMKWIRDPH
jgi:hypothetical protein